MTENGRNRVDLDKFEQLRAPFAGFVQITAKALGNLPCFPFFFHISILRGLDITFVGRWSLYEVCVDGTSSRRIVSYPEDSNEGVIILRYITFSITGTIGEGVRWFEVGVTCGGGTELLQNYQTVRRVVQSKMYTCVTK